MPRRIPFILFFLIYALLTHAQERKSNPLIIAHRGASGHAPENTIAAIDKAIEMGADVIEIDVHLTKDNVVMVMHDKKLNRTTNQKGLIKNFNWEEIKDADAGSWFSEKFAGEKIPTLEQVIQHVNGRTILLIEIKKGGECYPGIERRILDMINHHDAKEWCMIHSFSSAAVKNFLALESGMEVFKLALGNIPLLPLYHDGCAHWGSVLRYEDVAGVNLHRNFVKKRIVKRLHEREQKIFAWTVNREKDLKKLIEKGVDGIITNYPDKAKKAIE